MTDWTSREKRLQRRVSELEAALANAHSEIEMLSNHALMDATRGSTVSCPEAFAAVFSEAELNVRSYFENLKLDPTRASLEILGERYLLVRASALSYDFFRTIQQLYRERGEREASLIGKQLLFDVAHVMGREDARHFHAKAGLTDPIQRLAAGPVMFAHAGWAFVELRPECNPVIGDDYLLVYNHPFSFEASSWIKAAKTTDQTVCIMNAGYSSGWCQESFGLELTAVEISCRARGDKQCTFVMAPPGRLRAHVQRLIRDNVDSSSFEHTVEIPTFFARKRVEDEREAARQRAEELSKTKSRFLAKMSHEIRTPLNAVLGYVELALEETSLPLEHRGHLSTVRDSGQDLLRLLSDIMDLSKLEAQQLIIREEVCHIDTLLDAVHSFARPLLGGSKVELLLHAPPADVSSFVTDATRVKQVLFNLVSNAIKFTEKGQIAVETRRNREDETLEFHVRDTGCGISKAQQKMIFEAFTQVDDSLTRRQHGSGLGLAISHALVSRMGGTIAVESELNKGSHFFFSIPYAPSALIQPEADEPPSLDSVHAYSEETLILVVDDNAINRRLTTTIMKRLGCGVHEAKDGVEAVRMVYSSHRYSLILMDVQLPIMDGLEATRRIRKFEMEDGRPRVPVIALTAQAMQGDRQRCIDAGCDDYVSKPFTINALLQVTRNNLPPSSAD